MMKQMLPSALPQIPTRPRLLSRNTMSFSLSHFVEAVQSIEYHIANAKAYAKAYRINKKNGNGSINGNAVDRDHHISIAEKDIERIAGKGRDLDQQIQVAIRPTAELFYIHLRDNVFPELREEITQLKYEKMEAQAA